MNWEQSGVPCGVSGDWKVEEFTVTEQGASFHNMREAMHRTGRTIRPGTYKALKHRGAIIMSDTPAELADLWPIRVKALGHVLINGLGLGCVVQNLLGLEEPRGRVDHITVIEISPDVIALVGPYLLGRFGKERLAIIEADALTWKPVCSAWWDAVWHDIWPSICGDNRETMTQLKRRYGRRCGWQGAWAEDLIRERR